MPTLRQLKALSFIAQTGSFTRAAERLFITQSAVSALIRELEQEVGLPLIQRGRVLRLTEAGEHLQRAGHRADQEVARALEEIRGKRKWTEMVLRIAAGPLSAATLLPPALALIASGDSGLRVVLVDRPVGMVGDLLLSGEADVALGSLDPRLRVASELHSQLLLADSLCVVCSRESALATRFSTRRRKLAWKDLHESELILVGRVGGQWNSLLQDQLAANPELSVGYEVQLFSTAIELVRFGLGVAVLPRFATVHLDPEVFWTAALDVGDYRWNTYWLARRADSEAGSPAAVMLGALREVVGGGTNSSSARRRGSEAS